MSSSPSTTATTQGPGSPAAAEHLMDPNAAPTNTITPATSLQGNDEQQNKEQQSEKPPAGSPIPIGTLVRIVGAKRKELNGLFGHVTEPPPNRQPATTSTTTAPRIFIQLRGDVHSALVSDTTAPPAQSNYFVIVDPAAVIPYYGDEAVSVMEKQGTAPALGEPKTPPTASVVVVAPPSIQSTLSPRTEQEFLCNWQVLCKQLSELKPNKEENVHILTKLTRIIQQDCSTLVRFCVPALRDLVDAVHKYKLTSKDQALDEIITDKIDMLQAEFTSPARQISRVVKKIEELRDAIRACETAEATTAGAASEKTRQIHDLAIKCTEAEAELVARKLSLEQTKREKSKQDKDREREIAKNKNKLKEMQQMENALESLEQKIASASSATSVLSSRTLPHVEAQRKSKETAVTALEQQHKSLMEQTAEHRRIFNTLKMEVDALNAASKRLDVELVTTKQAMEAAKQTRNDIQQDINEKTATLNSLRTRSAALQQQLLMAQKTQPTNAVTKPRDLLPASTPLVASSKTLVPPPPPSHETDSECTICYNVIDSDVDLRQSDCRAMTAMAPCTCWKFCDLCIFTYKPGTLDVDGINLKALTNAKGSDLFKCPSCQMPVTRIICDRGFDADVRVGKDGKQHKKNGWDITFRNGKRPSIFVPTPADLANV